MEKNKITIVGNGLTGLTTALILGRLDLQINLIGNFKNKKNQKDRRTTAISPSNYNFLIKFLESNNSKYFWPSKKINLYYQDSDRYFNFMNFDNKGRNIMYTIKNSKLREIVLKKIKKNKKIRIINNEVKKIDEKRSIVYCKNKKINSDIILLCVGSRSELIRKLIGQRIVYNNFNEVAFTATVKHNLNINSAKQYFLKEGPLAILPLNSKEFSLVWSVNKNHNLEMMKTLIETRLKKILALKKSINISKIDFFPITFKFNSNFLKKNVLVLGEGLYNIHPVAGQGFNLIIRDIKELDREIFDHLSLGLQIKDSLLLNKFMLSRKPENLLFGLGVSFVHKFLQNNKVTNPIKKMVLKDINKLNFLKNISLNFANKGIF